MKVIFWSAISISCAWLLLAIAMGVVGISSFLAGGFRPAGRGFLEILTVFALTLNPLVVLFLIVRAVLRRGSGSPRQIVLRAFHPLALVLLMLVYAGALFHLNERAIARSILRWTTGSITYVCSPQLRTLEQVKAFRTEELRLTQRRQPVGLGQWTVTWAGKNPIKAASFPLSTGNFGGSQGIKWREPDGRQLAASIQFSDVITEYGPYEISIALQLDDMSAALGRSDVAALANYACEPDPASYRP